MTNKKVSDSIVETIHIVRPQHLNSVGRLFGGVLMQWIDEVACLVAKRHAHTGVTTASVDNLNFMMSAYQNDILVLIGKITFAGRTSMEVRVDTYREDLDGTRYPINRAYLTIVALDENDHPTEVPGLLIESPSEQMEWESAKKRREMRILRRREGF
ncbi:MAG: acyl-CoA thioesterase [Bariatricus sp.]